MLTPEDMLGADDRVSICVVFLVSRALAMFVLGVEFDATPLPSFWQYLDVPLLRSDLLRSLLLLHQQPPLWNLLLGLVVKLFPESHAAVLASTFYAVSLFAVLLLHTLARRVGAGRKTALAATLTFALSPALLFYETWLFYSLFEAALLLGACVGFAHAIEAPSLRTLLVYWSCLVLLTLIRATFHLAWVVLLGAAPLVFGRATLVRPLRAWLLLAAMLGAPLAWSAKNAMLFGSFTASSWMGMNLARSAISRVPDAERAELVKAGRLSPLSLVGPFAPLAKYPPEWRESTPFGHPALDARTKSSGDPNFNHAAYLRISRQLLADSIVVMSERPRAVLRNWVAAWHLFFRPSEDYTFYHSRRKTRLFVNYTEAFQGTVLVYVRSRFLSVSLLYVTAYVLGCCATLSALNRLRAGRAASRDLVTAFVGVNLLFSSALPNLIEVGENQRFKFSVEGLLWVFLAWGATGLVRRVERSFSRLPRIAERAGNGPFPGPTPAADIVRSAR